MEATTLAESLGVRITGLGGSKTVTPTAERDWRLDLALTAICRGRPVTSHELEVVLGHVTVRALLCRCLYSVLNHSYDFVQKGFEARRPVWRSVARELGLFRDLMVLGFARLDLPWSPGVLCTDACLSGYAVMAG